MIIYDNGRKTFYNSAAWIALQHLSLSEPCFISSLISFVISPEFKNFVRLFGS